MGVRVRVYVATSLGYEPWDILLAPMCSPDVHDLVILNLEPNTRFVQASTQLTVGIAHEELPDSFPFRRSWLKTGAPCGYLAPDLPDKMLARGLVFVSAILRAGASASSIQWAIKEQFSSSDCTMNNLTLWQAIM